MRKILLFALLSISLTAVGQTLKYDSNDTTIVMEYYDGQQWAFRKINGVVIGLTNSGSRDEYGKCYQVGIYIRNENNRSVVFYPERITSVLKTKKGEEKPLLVYSYNAYMRKVERSQDWDMALNSIAVGINTGMAGHRTAYVSGWSPGTGVYSGTVRYYDSGAAAAAGIYGSMYLNDLEEKQYKDRRLISKGYLKTTTIHPGEEILGYIKIKRKRGEEMKIVVPINNSIFAYDWILQKYR